MTASTRLVVGYFQQKWHMHLICGFNHSANHRDLYTIFILNQCVQLEFTDHHFETIKHLQPPSRPPPLFLPNRAPWQMLRAVQPLEPHCRPHRHRWHRWHRWRSRWLGARWGAGRHQRRHLIIAWGWVGSVANDGHVLPWKSRGATVRHVKENCLEGLGCLWHVWITKNIKKWLCIQKKRENTTCSDKPQKTNGLKPIIFDQKGFSRRTAWVWYISMASGKSQDLHRFWSHPARPSLKNISKTSKTSPSAGSDVHLGNWVWCSHSSQNPSQSSKPKAPAEESRHLKPFKSVLPSKRWPIVQTISCDPCWPT